LAIQLYQKRSPFSFRCQDNLIHLRNLIKLELKCCVTNPFLLRLEIQQGIILEFILILEKCIDVRGSETSLVNILKIYHQGIIRYQSIFGLIICHVWVLNQMLMISKKFWLIWNYHITFTLGNYKYYAPAGDASL